MGRLEKFLRKYAKKTVASIETNSIAMYFYEATKKNKINIIRIYQSDFGIYRIKVTKEKKL